MRFLFSALLLLFASFAHADSISSFQFNSDLTGGYSAQGLVSVDTTDGQVTSSYFTLSQGGTVDAIFSQPDYSQPIDGVYLAEFQGSTPGYTYELLLPNASLVGYQGGALCTSASTCLGYSSGVILPNGGNAVALDGSMAATPEPSSLILLGSGAVAAFLIKRRSWI